MLKDFLQIQPDLSMSEYGFIAAQIAIVLVAILSGIGGYL